MALIKRRNSTKLFPTSRNRTRHKLSGMVINSGIAVLSLLLIAFVFSFSSQQTQSGVPIEVSFPSLPKSPRLAVDVYESNPVLEINIEVLNGCGEPGLASKFSDYLRSKRIDVVREDNANHFEYDQTILIQRNENVEGLRLVAAALGFDINNRGQVKIEIDGNSDVDMTLIVGKDFQSIVPVINYLKP